MSSNALYVRATRCNVVDSCLSGRPSISPTTFVYVMVAYFALYVLLGFSILRFSSCMIAGPPDVLLEKAVPQAPPGALARLWKELRRGGRG